MSKKRSTRRFRPRKLCLHEPSGALGARVQQVGPEHFGIVCFDVAKKRSRWMMSDFYGKVLIEPNPVDHARGQLQMAIAWVGDMAQKQDIRDLVVVIERTGNYHLPVKRAFEAARFRDTKFDTRILHPFATKQHRLPSDAGNKTDDTDLAAMFRATVNGYGLVERSWDETHRQLQVFARHRRDLVEKRSTLMCQIREQLEATLPGYAAVFEKFWESNVAIPLAQLLSSPARFAELGIDGLADLLRENRIRFQQRSLRPLVAWANNAAPQDEQAATRHRIFLDLQDDRSQKSLKIAGLEEELAHYLVRTPYVLLLSCPGINVVSAAELAGEMGPITNYARANHITGRAALYPSRYQSDEVDKHGALVRRGNHRLRFVLMMIADNLMLCNMHFAGLARLWRSQGQDERHIRTKVACRVARIVFQLAAGRQVLRHPGIRERDYILQKLVRFHQEHGSPIAAMMTNLQHAVHILPKSSHAEEAAPLVALLAKAQHARRGPVRLADVLPLILAKLGVGDLQSNTEEQEPSSPQAET
jgi:transposase